MTTSDHQTKFLVSKVAAGGFDARKKLISSLRSPHHCLDCCEVVGHCTLFTSHPSRPDKVPSISDVTLLSGSITQNLSLLAKVRRIAIQH